MYNGYEVNTLEDFFFRLSTWMCSEAGERTRYQNPSLLREEISPNVSHSTFRHWEHPLGCPLLSFLSQLWPMVWFFRRSWRGGIHCIFLPTRTHILITPLLEKAIFFFLFYFLNYESMITHLQETWGGSAGKESACNAGELGQSLSWEDPLEKGKATHSSVLAWRIPWTV